METEIVEPVEQDEAPKPEPQSNTPPEPQQEEPAQPVPRSVETKIERLKRESFQLRGENALLSKQLGELGLLELRDDLSTSEWIARRQAQIDHGRTNEDSIPDEDASPLSADPDFAAGARAMPKPARGEGAEAEPESTDESESEAIERTPEEEAQLHADRVKTLTDLGAPPEVAEIRAQAQARIEKEFPDHASRFKDALDFVPQSELPGLLVTAANIEISAGLQRAIAQLENSADVVLELAKNPQWAEALNRMPRGVQSQVLGSLSADLAALNDGDSEGPSREVLDSYNTKADAFAETHPDFDSLCNDQQIEMSEAEQRTFQAVVEAVHELGRPDLAYHIVKHQDVLTALLGMSPRRAVTELGRLSAELEDSEGTEELRPKRTKPAPISPVKKVSPTSTGLNDDLDIDTWMKRREKQVAAGRSD